MKRKLYALYNRDYEILAVGTMAEIAEGYGLTLQYLRYLASKKNTFVHYDLIRVEEEEL